MKNTDLFNQPTLLSGRFVFIGILLLFGSLLSAQTVNDRLVQQFRIELQEQGGFKAAEIDKMVLDYTKLLNQKNSKLDLRLPISSEMKNNPANCKNGSFEDPSNNFASWSFFTGCNNGGLPIGSGISTTKFCNISNCTCNSLGANVQGTSIGSCGQLHASRNSGGFDPTLASASPAYNIPYVPIGGGSRSIVLGNKEKCYAVEGVYRTIVLPAVNPTITFKYATVMQKSHSMPDGSPAGSEVFFLVRVKDLSGTIIKRYEEIGNPNNPFIQKTNNEQIFFRDWECVTLDMKGYEGKTVVVEFINSDCSAGGHWGYTYLDDFCGTCRGASSGGTVNIVKSDSCITTGTKVSGSFILPTSGSNTGTLSSIQLQIYQSGALVNTVNAPVISGSNYSFNLNPGDFPVNANVKCYDIIVKATFSLVNPLSGQTSTIIGYSSILALKEGIKPGLNNDICYCPEPTCCPSENLIQNPFFDGGNVGFTSDYTYEATAASNSVMPGEYGIINGAQALAISPQWNIKNPVTCNSTSKFLVVNGRTGQLGQKKIWEQTITGLIPNTPYRFCVKLKNLPQCAFDVQPKVQVQFSSGASPMVQTIATTSNPCDWALVSTNVTPTASTLTIKILLDETPIGDGNDLAIDAFGLHATPPLPKAYRDFTVQSMNMNAALETYNVLATPAIPLPNGCSYFWDICEIDCTGPCKNCNMGNCKPNTQVANPSQWWTGGTTNFPGYNGTSTLSGSAPGVFEYRKRYLIKRAVFCDCNAWSESLWCLEYDPGSRKIQIRRVGGEE